MYAHHLKTPKPNEVYVAWKDCLPSVSPPPCLSILTSPQDSPQNSSDSDETDIDTDSYHVVKFKCIGVRKDDDGQSFESTGSA